MSRSKEEQSLLGDAVNAVAAVNIIIARAETAGSLGNIGKVREIQNELRSAIRDSKTCMSFADYVNSHYPKGVPVVLPENMIKSFDNLVHALRVAINNFDWVTNDGTGIDQQSLTELRIAIKNFADFINDEGEQIRSRGGQELHTVVKFVKFIGNQYMQSLVSELGKITY